MNTSTDSSASSPGPSPNRRWRAARRLLVAVAALGTIAAVFYTVENWRGRRAWENRRRELEAKGEVLDWNAYIPAPVPDDQNFFKAPKMQEWFVKDSMLSLLPQQPGKTTNPPSPFALAPRQATNLLLAELTLVPRDRSPESLPADAVLRLADPAARERAARLLRQAIGPGVDGARGGVLVARPLNEIKPLHLALQADAAPTAKELADFFPANPLNKSERGSANISYLQIEPAGSNAFRVSLKSPVYSAADYLSWTEPLTTHFDLVRKALERPYSRIDCDYRQPYAIGIPHFIRVREAVQILAERTQSKLLLGQPESAWHELALIHDLCRLLLAEPSGKPMTLVAAMINVAVGGLYVGIIQDGLRLHAWNEPQLLAIEQQLRETDLLKPVVEAFREERAATCRTFETTSRRELVKLFSVPNSPSKLVLSWIPSGWFFQNMVLGAQVEQEIIESLDLTNQLVRSRHISETTQDLTSRLKRHSLYNFLVTMSLPNFAKAVQTATHNQTLVNQARIACALERFRLARQEYPETLDALNSPPGQTLPRDLIGGQPLKYRRSADGGYLLYSVGWDEKDNGGVPAKSLEEGDWVWELR